MQSRQEFNFRSKTTVVLIIALVMVGVFAATTARADELYGKVRGIVTDPAGAIVTGVQLKLTNAGTGVAKELTSGPDGSFTFINLNPGKYSLSATRSGFKLYEAKGIEVTQNQIFVQNIAMEVGAVSETVEVTANPVQVESTSIQLGANIAGDSIRDVPLNGRNWIVLQQTLPGVVSADTRFGNNFSTNGSQAQQNSYLVNGNDANDLPLNSPLAQPNPDAIAEVQMVTNTINPEFGRNSGAILNAVTKSGSNSLHGSAFEFYRDTFLNTHNYFQTLVPVFHQNQFGGTIGGPVWKNKLFFFYALQLTRNRVPDVNFGNTGAIPVLTSAQLSGDYSGVLGPADCDPANCTPISSNAIPGTLTNINGASGVCPGAVTWADCFPNRVIPTTVFNPLSTQLVQKFVPAPNCNTNEFCFNPTTATKTNQHIGRMDLSISAKDAVWFYALANNSTQTNAIPFSGATLPGFGDGSVPWTKQFTASWIHTFSGNVLNEFRVGYSRLNFQTGQPQNVRQPADVGFSNIFPQLPSGADYPSMAVTGYFTLGGTTNGPQPRKDQTYQLTDNFSVIHGRHNFKFGFDGRRFQVWNPFAARNEGAFTFDASGTFSTNDPSLDFLLGIPQSYNQQSGQVIVARAHEYYGYVQDQWRVKDNLTLTLGTGYQVDTPIEELQNGGLSRACFRPGVQSKAFPDAPPGLLYPGDPGCNKYGGATTKFNHFGPRVGFAWSPGWGGGLTGGTGKTSIRGGFGLYFNRGEEELNLQDLGVPPFGQGSSGIGDSGGTPSFPDPWQNIDTGGTTTNKFPYVPPAAGATGIDFSQFFPLAISVVDKNLTTPYAMNWNLTYQRELPARMILQVGYVGAHGSKLITAYSFNPTTPAGVTACAADPSCVSDRAFQPVDFPDHYANDGSIWGNSGIQTNGGWSNYHSLQVTLDKHMSHGLEFRSAYSWAHSLDVSSSFEDTAFQASGAFDAYGHFQRDYGSSAFDARHRWVVTGVYDIPDLAKHLNWGGGASRILGGWRLTGINALQKGLPINFQDSSYRSLTCTGVLSFYACPDRPDIVSTPTALDPRNSATHLYFATASFAHNAFGTQGTTPRGYLKGPGLWNTDFSFQKDTKITEGKSLQLRIEFFNLLNHTNFANPSGNRNSSLFGRVTAIQRNTNSRLIQLGAKFSF